MTQEILARIAGGLAGLLVLWAITRRSRRPWSVKDGVLELGYSNLFRWTVWAIALAIFGLLIGLAVSMDWANPDPDHLRTLALCTPILGSLGLACTFEPFVKYQADHQGVRGQTAFRGERSVDWDELVAASYSPSNRYFKLVDAGGEVVRVGAYLQGFEAFVQLAARHAPLEVLDDRFQRVFLHHLGAEYAAAFQAKLAERARQAGA